MYLLFEMRLLFRNNANMFYKLICISVVGLGASLNSMYVLIWTLIYVMSFFSVCGLPIAQSWVIGVTAKSLVFLALLFDEILKWIVLRVFVISSGWKSWKSSTLEKSLKASVFLSDRDRWNDLTFINNCLLNYLRCKYLFYSTYTLNRWVFIHHFVA